ncbi:hypothetical protein U1Q18_037856, partial [Sarracenia purpurea var. burkii]
MLAKGPPLDLARLAKLEARILRLYKIKESVTKDLKVNSVAVGVSGKEACPKPSSFEQGMQIPVSPPNEIKALAFDGVNVDPEDEEVSEVEEGVCPVWLENK